MHPLILLLLVVLPSQPAPKVSARTLEELVRFSDRVVIGRVERVLAVPRPGPYGQDAPSGLGLRASVPIAQVQVERTLHGPPVDRVNYLACGTWTCDTSSAEEGERVLLFLRDSRWMHEESPAFVEELATACEGAVVYQDAHSGRGRMPLREVDGELYANLWAGDVILPDSIPTIDDPSEEYDWYRSAGLAPLEAYVRRTSEHVLPRLSVQLRPRPATIANGWVESWIWADGVSCGTFGSGRRRGPAVRAEYRLARADGLAEALGRAGLLAGPHESGVRSLTYLDAGSSWRLVGAVLDEAEWEGPQRPLVLRARAHWNAMMGEALRARASQR